MARTLPISARIPAEDAEFLAERFGGTAADYDSRNGENVISGDTVAWDQLFALANAGVATPEAYAAISRLLDVPAFIDFMLVHLYGGSADIDAASNWYAARPRRPDGRYVFLMWDGERSLEEVNADALGLDADQSPTRLFQKLRENAAFRRAFAQRVKRLTAKNGALEMRFPPGWLDDHPLTVADLQSEIEHLKGVGFKLRVFTAK